MATGEQARSPSTLQRIRSQQGRLWARNRQGGREPKIECPKCRWPSLRAYSPLGRNEQGRLVFPEAGSGYRITPGRAGLDYFAPGRDEPERVYELPPEQERIYFECARGAAPGPSR
jgi:hypothetical protein